MRFVNPLPFVADVPASVAFYRDVIGIEPTDVYDDFVAFEGGFALHQGDALHRHAFGEGPTSDEPWGRQNLVLYFVSEDLDAAYARVSAAAPILHEVREIPSGERVFRCLDPDGHVVEIGDGAQMAAAD